MFLLILLIILEYIFFFSGISFALFNFIGGGILFISISILLFILFVKLYFVIAFYIKVATFNYLINL